ncbi:MAG: hypothetical protein FWG05_06545, partial [Kiritimatiellaeota bacterium]|nr:hypothetical protein [Kiritimatiellota bacterium]
MPKRAKRAVVFFAALAILFSFFYYPKRERELFLTLPDNTVVAMRAHNLAFEYRALAHNHVVTGILERAGVDSRDIGSFQKNASTGVFWTLLGLTGEDSVVGYVPAAGFGNDVLPGYLAGASYTGWRARFIELLWRLKWCPGLGKLGVTSRGTRYLEFDTAPGFENLRYLGLDIHKGTLFATYSDDPDDVIP